MFQARIVYLIFLIFFITVLLHQIGSYRPTCHVEKWNRKTTRTLPNEEQHLRWIRQNGSRRDNILGAQIRLISAFVYEEYVAVTTTSQHSFGQPVTCHYFNCQREEIADSAHFSQFFPQNVVYCGRRDGAEYISLKMENETQITRTPIPLIFRIFEAPKFAVSICLGPLYGPEPKWLEIIEFVEHYKLLGVSYFYITVFQISQYDRKILDEYEKNGEIEVTVIQSEYAEHDWQFHMLQINECHQRAKYHSKWVLNIDIDERLVFSGSKSGQIYEQLLKNRPENIVELHVAIQRVQKTGKVPRRYESERQLWREMEFLKYNQSAKITWDAYKSIYRPEKTAAMYYHWSYMKYANLDHAQIPETLAYFRHYRTTEPRGLGYGWTSRYGSFEEMTSRFFSATKNFSTKTMADNLVKTIEAGPIFMIGLNRADKKNCVNHLAARQLIQQFEKFNERDDLKCAILYGEGGTFCAGYDLEEVSNGNFQKIEKEFLEKYRYMGPSIMPIKKPLIAAIEGYAVAGGLELSLMADLRVCSKSAKMGVFCRRVGVPLIDGGTVRLPRVVGFGRAMDLMLTGREIGADEALMWGLVNRVTEDGQALSEAVKLAKLIVSHPEKCMLADRSSAYYSLDHSTQESFDFEFQSCRVLSDSIQGASKFLVKKSKI